MRLTAILTLGILSSLTLGLSGCGQKGPLYLPDSQQEQQR